MNKKEIIISESQNNKILLPRFLYKAIVNKNTSLGDNPALPPYGDFGFEYDVIKKKYEDVSDRINKMIENGELESNNIDYLISHLSKLMRRCISLETPLRPQLQKLCENIVNATFSIPDETVLLSCKLVDKIKPKNGIRILPESDDASGNTYDFEDVEEVEMTNKVILKRRFVNSLIQGFSYWLSTDIDDWYDDVKTLNEELWSLWHEIIYINDYLLFNKQEKIDEKNPMQQSYVEVHLGRKGKKTAINAQGIIFPYLLRDTFRGFFELFSSHGLPEDISKTMYIVRKADFLVAEPWDLRFGMGIVEILQNVLTKKYGTKVIFETNRIPFFFTEICSLETDEFNSVIKNFILGTNKGRIIANTIDKNITHDFDYQEFKDKIQQKNVQTSLISDGDFSKEELDDYVIQENETDEMMAYHGSSHDFDKFNHKKYLNTGAGSQCFGWGTYVTDDKAVANGYSNVGEEKDVIEDYIYWKESGYDYWHIKFDKSKKFNNEFIKKYSSYFTRYLGYDNADNAAELAFNILLSHQFSKSESLESCRHYITLLKDDEILDAHGEKMNPEKRDFLIKMYKCVIGLLVRLNSTNPKRFVYEVDVPDDNGFNYLSWYEKITDEQQNAIYSKIYNFNKKYGSDYDYYIDTNGFFFNENEYDSIAKDNRGNEVYHYLQEEFSKMGVKNCAKAASLFLMQCGFDGIKYPAGTRWQKPDGAAEDAMNYVIFDANKVKIVNKTTV